MPTSVEVEVRYEAWVSDSSARMPTADEFDALSVSIMDELARRGVVDPAVMWDTTEGLITFRFAEPSNDDEAHAAVRAALLAAGIATPDDSPVDPADRWTWHVRSDRFSFCRAWDGASFAM